VAIGFVRRQASFACLIFFGSFFYQEKKELKRNSSGKAEDLTQILRKLRMTKARRESCG